MTPLETLLLIAQRSPAATRAALGAIKRQRKNSPMAAAQAARAAEQALSDYNVEWTSEERAAIVALLKPGQEARGGMIGVRVSAQERATLQAAADAAELSLSAYVRRTLGLE